MLLEGAKKDKVDLELDRVNVFKYSSNLTKKYLVIVMDLYNNKLGLRFNCSYYTYIMSGRVRVIQNL